MSISMSILLVLVAALLYYLCMIAYDLYVAKMTSLESEEFKEVPVDVSEQLDDFISYDVDPTTDSEHENRKSFENFICKGISPTKMNELMEDAATGTPNADLKNLIYKCDQILMEQDVQLN